jgi:hypothetical protein
MNRVRVSRRADWLDHSVLIGVLVISSHFVCIPVNAGNVFVTDYKTSEEVAVKKLEDDAIANKVTLAQADIDKVSKWITFADDEKMFGDAAVTFGEGVEYKINAINYNLYFGDNVKVPFQLYYGEFKSDDSPEDENQKKLLDPTQGIAVQFPLARRYQGKTKGGFCNFEEREGYCVVGGDITLRGVQLVETLEDESTKEKLIFGASAGLRASVLFPVFKKDDDGNQAGNLGLSLGARYYYHNTDQQELLFGPIEDPEGNPIEFKKDFAAATAEMEFNIYKNFTVRLEYFYPFDNRDVLDDVFKASFVVAPGD